MQDATGFLYNSLGGSIVQFHDCLASRHACACSKAEFSSKNGDRASRVYYRRTEFCCTFLCGREGSVERIFLK
jgi:hypothetical protein